MTPLAATLRRLRTERAMTQEALAAVTGIKQTAISRYEKGKTLPDVLSLLKLATGLKVPLEALVEGVDVRFDLVYQGLHVTATTDDSPAVSATPTETATPPLDPSMDQIVRGFPSPGDQGEGDDDSSEVAAAHAALQRAAADILSAARFLAPRHHPVARDLGPGVRRGAARHGVRKSAAHPKKTAAKRR
jgi:transcriptional regulator with XRE-family HTH domain